MIEISFAVLDSFGHEVVDGIWMQLLESLKAISHLLHH